MYSRLIVATLALCCSTAQALCEFDQFGTISNPDDPACRDTQLVYTENDSSGNNIALGYPPPVPVDTLTAIDGFRTYDSLFARHQDLMLIHAAVAGTVIGQSRLGRDIWAYSLGDGDNLTLDGFPEPAVIVNGGIHAREWQSPEVLTEILEQLVETSADTNVGQFLHDNLNVVLIPVLNVDGFIQTQNFPTRVTADERQPRDGRMRRKNMLIPSGGLVDDDIDTTGDSFFGVDLNRNSVHGFGLNSGSSSNEVSLVYRGAASSSEPEIVALRAATGLGPAERLRLGVDVHSFSRVYFTPLTGNARRDAITRSLAERMRAVTSFRYRYSADPAGSFGIGTVADYFAYEFQIPAWTLEIEPLNGGQDYGGTGASHSGFVLPDSEIARVRDELAETFLLGFFRQSGPPHVVAAQIREVPSDEIVYEAEWITTGSTRELTVSVDKALVPGIQYILWVAFSKPMRWFDETLNLNDFPGQSSVTNPIRLTSADAGETFSRNLVFGDMSWRRLPGGAPDGYLRYRGDALRTVFYVPSEFGDSISDATAASLQIEISDLAEMQLDANPATVSDWSDGHWTGYEDSAGEDSDSGGADCTLVTFIALDPAAAPPDKTSLCPAAAAAMAPPAPPPASTPAPTPVPSSGGGGGGSGLWLIATIALLMRRR